MPDKRSNPAEDAIAAMGGITATAEALGIPVTTVSSWKEKGRIPRWRRPALIEAAQRLGKALPAAFLNGEAAA